MQTRCSGYQYREMSVQRHTCTLFFPNNCQTVPWETLGLCGALLNYTGMSQLRLWLTLAAVAPKRQCQQRRPTADEGVCSILDSREVPSLGHQNIQRFGEGGGGEVVIWWWRRYHSFQTLHLTSYWPAVQWLILASKLPLCLILPDGEVPFSGIQNCFCAPSKASPCGSCWRTRVYI